MQQIFNTICSALLMIQVLAVFAYCRKRKRETELLRQQERFLGEVAVSYTRASDLKDAIRESIKPQDTLMAAEGNLLLDSLERNSANEVMDYLAKAKNSFFSVFYALCHMVRDLGDIQKEGQSLFVKNIQYIEEEVRMEILRIQNAGYQFSGLLAVCAVPFFLIPLIRDWAVSVESGMEGFYGGSYGMGTTLVCYAAASVGIFFILWLHYPDLKAARSYRIEQYLLAKTAVCYVIDKKISRRYSYFLKKNEELKKLQGFGNIRQFLVRRYLSAALCAALMFAGIVLVKQTGRMQMRQEFVLAPVWTVELSEMEKKNLSEQMQQEFEQMIAEGRDTADLSQESGWVMYSTQIQKACEKLLEEQKEVYGQIRFRWYDFLLLALSLLGGAAIPQLELALCRWNVEQKKMEETLRFETLILVLKHYPMITVEEILNWLESFAEIFRRALERAVDSFSYERADALRKLREDAGYEPVGRIADALLSCDEVRIVDAFLNMEAERNYYMDQYKQKVHAWTGERAAIAKVTAFVPFLLVMALKLIVPFVAQGLGQLTAYNDGMAGFM